MKKVLFVAALGLLGASTSFAENCLVDAESGRADKSGYAFGNHCPEVTVKSSLSTSLELVDSSNGMCRTEYSVIIDDHLYSVFLFDAARKSSNAGAGVGCKIKINFESGETRSLLLQVNKD